MTHKLGASIRFFAKLFFNLLCRSLSTMVILKLTGRNSIKTSKWQRTKLTKTNQNYRWSLRTSNILQVKTLFSLVALHLDFSLDSLLHRLFIHSTLSLTLSHCKVCRVCLRVTSCYSHASHLHCKWLENVDFFSINYFCQVYVKVAGGNENGSSPILHVNKGSIKCIWYLTTRQLSMCVFKWINKWVTAILMP